MFFNVFQGSCKRSGGCHTYSSHKQTNSWSLYYKWLWLVLSFYLFFSSSHVYSLKLILVLALLFLSIWAPVVLPTIFSFPPCNFPSFPGSFDFLFHKSFHYLLSPLHYIFFLQPILLPPSSIFFQTEYELIVIYKNKTTFSHSLTLNYNPEKLSEDKE